MAKVDIISLVGPKNGGYKLKNAVQKKGRSPKVGATARALAD